MTCKNIDEFLDFPDRVRDACLPAGVARHAEECERCRKLLEFFQASTPEEKIRPEVQSEIETVLRQSLAPVAPLRPPNFFASVFFAIFFCLPLAAILLLGSAQVMTATQTILVAALLLGGGLLLAISLSRQMAPASRHRIHPKVLHVLTVSVFLLAVVLLFPWEFEGDFLRRGMLCSLHGLMFAIPSAFAFWLIIRRGATLALPVLGVTTGLLAGFAGAMVLHFHCDVPEASHLAIWHVGVPIFCGLAGYLLGKLSGLSTGETHSSTSA
jgi:hypothetical protein